MERKDGGQMFSLVPDISVRVVLKNGYVVFFRDFNEHFAPFHRHGGTAGIVEVHDGVDNLIFFPSERAFSMMPGRSSTCIPSGSVGTPRKLPPWLKKTVRAAR